MSTSTVIVSAADLYRMIDLLTVTAAKPNAEDLNYPSIVLFTQHGSHGGEVGSTNFLCGASSRLTVAGTEAIVSSGELDGMWRLTPTGRNELTAMLKSWIKEDKEAQVKIRVSDSGSTTVSLLDADDRAVRLYLEPADGWPVMEVFDMLSGAGSEDEVFDKDEHPLPAGKRIRLSDVTLDSLAKVAKKLGGSLDLIVTAHPASVILAEKDGWVGAVLGEEYPFDIDVEGREDEYFEPDEYLAEKDA